MCLHWSLASGYICAQRISCEAILSRCKSWRTDKCYSQMEKFYRGLMETPPLSASIKIKSTMVTIYTSQWPWPNAQVSIKSAFRKVLPLLTSEVKRIHYPIIAIRNGNSSGRKSSNPSDSAATVESEALLLPVAQLIYYNPESELTCYS